MESAEEFEVVLLIPFYTFHWISHPFSGMKYPTMWYVRPAKAYTQSDQSLC